MKKQIIEETITNTYFCYSCGKKLKRPKWGRVSESPKDKFGIKVPLCHPCYFNLCEK